MAKLFLPFSLTPPPLPFSHAFLEIRFKGWKTNEMKEKKIEKKRALEQSPESFLVILGKFQTTTTT